MMAAAVAAALTAYSGGDTPPLSSGAGLAWPSPDHWVDSPLWSLGLSLGLNLLVAMLTVYINRTYNVLRSMTMLFAGLFFVMQAATPALMSQLCGGIIVCITLILCILILFSIYGRPDSTRRVFLLFFITALTALCQYAIMFYIPLLLLGCAQMRVLNPRSFLAAVTGCVTPLWIFMGLGLIPLTDFRWPDFDGYFSVITSRETLPLAVTVGVTTTIGVLFTMLNLIKILSYNSRTRAYNGFFSLLFFATAILIIIDFVDVTVYVPLLNCCTAFQIGHFFTLRRGRRSYIGILVIILIYTGLYLWNITG